MVQCQAGSYLMDPSIDVDPSAVLHNQENVPSVHCSHFVLLYWSTWRYLSLDTVADAHDPGSRAMFERSDTICILHMPYPHMHIMDVAPWSSLLRVSVISYIIYHSSLITNRSVNRKHTIAS